MSDPAEHVHGAPAGEGHERRDVDERSIVGAGAGLAVAITVVTVAMLLLFNYYARREAAMSPPANPLAVQAGPRLPPAPRLQTAPIEDIQALRERERSALESYGWVNREQGVVRIPIERAIDLLAERGLPARQKEQKNK